MNPVALSIVLMIAGGAAFALQAPTNAKLATGLMSPVNAALVSFIVGGVALAILAMAQGARPDWTATRGLPAWVWTGGFYGALAVGATVYATPRIGVTTALTLAVAAQLATALAVDHFGWLGAEVRPVSAIKLLGVAVVAAGVFLVRKG
ncbi:MAG TPA: DMT family transporter [Caulobacteraceae bacterium]